MLKDEMFQALEKKEKEWREKMKATVEEQKYQWKQKEKESKSAIAKLETEAINTQSDLANQLEKVL